MNEALEKRLLSFENEEDRVWLLHELRNIGTAFQSGVELLELDRKSNRDPSSRVTYLQSCLKRLEVLIRQIE